MNHQGLLIAYFAIASTEAVRDVVREGEAPAEPSLHRQVGSACEYPARQEPRPPENRKLLAVSYTRSKCHLPLRGKARGSK